MSLNNTHTHTVTQTEYYSLVLVLTLNQSTELICWWPPSIMHHSRCHFEKRAIECSLFLANAPKWLTLVDVVHKKIHTDWTSYGELNTVEKKVVTNRKKATTESESATLAQKSNWSINLCHVPLSLSEILTIRIEMNELFSTVVHLSYQAASFVHLCFGQSALVQLCPKSLGLFANLSVLVCWPQ